MYWSIPRPVKGKKRAACFSSVCILFALMQLTPCDEVTGVLDEFTGGVRPLVTCTTSRLYDQINADASCGSDLILKISEVAAAVEGL